MASGLMSGKRGLVMGVANDKSIAWGIAQACHEAGAELAFTYQGEALGRRVQPLAASVGSDVVLPCDESCALQGIRAGANRSGAVLRLIGTSTAAPQLARWVANPPIPAPHDVPTSTSEEHKRGGGDVDPP